MFFHCLPSFDQRNIKMSTDSDVVLDEKITLETKEPKMHKVIFLNDSTTPMEFVVMVLEKVFNKKSEEATQIMLHVHKNGIGVCGIFSYEIAETKVIQVLDTSRKNNHPLQCTMEKV